MNTGGLLRILYEHVLRHTSNISSKWEAPSNIKIKNQCIQTTFAFFFKIMPVFELAHSNFITSSFHQRTLKLIGFIAFSPQ